MSSDGVPPPKPTAEPRAIEQAIAGLRVALKDCDRVSRETSARLASAKFDLAVSDLPVVVNNELQGLSRVVAALPQRVDEVRWTIQGDIDALLVILHRSAGTPPLYLKPKRRRRRPAAPRLNERPTWPEGVELVHQPAPTSRAVALNPLWVPGAITVAHGPDGPHGDEALGVALRAVADHDPDHLRSLVHYEDTIGNGLGNVAVVSFPFLDPIDVGADLPWTKRREGVWGAADSPHGWELDEPAGVTSTDGSTGIGFLAKAYAAVGEYTDPDPDLLDVRVANALTCLTGQPSEWQPIAVVPDDASLAAHLDQPLTVVTSRRITVTDPAHEVATAHGLVPEHPQAYVVDGVDAAGQVWMSTPMGRSPHPMSVADVRRCFTSVIVGQPPAHLGGISSEIDLGGLGSVR